MKLVKESIGFSSNFGVVDLDEESIQTVEDEDTMDIDTKSVLLTDIEGEEEEISAKKTISVIVDEKGNNLKSLTIIGDVNSDQLRRSIELAKVRSKVFTK